MYFMVCLYSQEYWHSYDMIISLMLVFSNFFPQIKIKIVFFLFLDGLILNLHTIQWLFSGLRQI